MISAEQLGTYSVNDEILAWLVESVVHEDGAQVSMWELGASYLDWTYAQGIICLNEPTWTAFTSMVFFGDDYPLAHGISWRSSPPIRGYRLRTPEDDNVAV